MSENIVHAPSLTGLADAQMDHPPQEGEGPWLIRSNYWGRWHCRSEDGGACGYTDDIARAGIFDFAKAHEYHDHPGRDRRDEAIPARRVIADMEARLARMDAERAEFSAKVWFMRGVLSAPNRSDEPSVSAHGTAREPNTSIDQVIAELCRALWAAESWFREYAEHHRAKPDRLKAERNEARANYCRDARAKAQARGAAG